METRQDIEQQANAQATGEEINTTTAPHSQATRHPSNAEPTMSATMTATIVSPPTHLPPLQTQLTSKSSPQPDSPTTPTSLSQKRTRSPMSISIPSTPALSNPSPPTNTLLITRLTNPSIFHPASLATIRQHIASLLPSPSHINSFSPLKSLARIIVSFATTPDCIAVRTAIDGTAFTDSVVAKCYFGEPTPLVNGDDAVRYLDKPDAGKLFFISPPPSPPVGWESRLEDAPNREVHADDLAAKLGALTSRLGGQDGQDGMVTAEELSQLKAQSSADKTKSQSQSQSQSRSKDVVGASPITPPRRSRSSTLIYDPRVHGDSPNLPAVTVESEEDDVEVQLDDGSRGPPVHTSRPPVELM